MSNYGDYSKHSTTFSTNSSNEVSSSKSTNGSFNAKKAPKFGNVEKVNGVSDSIIESKDIPGATLSKPLSELKGKIKEKKIEVKQIEKKASEVRAARDKLSELNPTKFASQIEQLEKAHQSLQLNIIDVRQGIEELKKQREQLTTDLKTLKNVTLEVSAAEEQLGIGLEKKISAEKRDLKESANSEEKAISGSDVKMLQAEVALQVIDIKQRTSEHVQYLRTIVNNGVGQLSPVTSKEEAQEVSKLIKSGDVFHFQDGMIIAPKSLKLPFKAGDEINEYDDQGKPLLDDEGREVKVKVIYIHHMEDEEFNEIAEAFTTHFNNLSFTPQLVKDDSDKETKKSSKTETQPILHSRDKDNVKNSNRPKVEIILKSMLKDISLSEIKKKLSRLEDERKKVENMRKVIREFINKSDLKYDLDKNFVIKEFIKENNIKIDQNLMKQEEVIVLFKSLENGLTGDIKAIDKNIKVLRTWLKKPQNQSTRF